MFGRWRRKREDARAAKQQADVHALDREGDPRGGVQSEQYRLAEPRDVVAEDGVVMSGPAGAPQDEEPVDERRARDQEDRPVRGGERRAKGGEDPEPFARE